MDDVEIDSSSFVWLGSVELAHAHAAEADGRHGVAGAAEGAAFHGILLGGTVRGVTQRGGGTARSAAVELCKLNGFVYIDKRDGLPWGGLTPFRGDTFGSPETYAPKILDLKGIVSDRKRVLRLDPPETRCVLVDLR